MTEKGIIEPQRPTQSLQIKVSYLGVSVVAQWKRMRLGTMRLQVQSLASLSGLRIRPYHELWCRLQTWLGSDVAVAVARSCNSD